MVDADKAKFEDWVERTVALALRQSQADFSSLTSSLPGIYPEEVLRALRALDGRDAQRDGISASLAASACWKAVIPQLPSALLGLLPPHPLDFEWRFAPDAIDFLAEAVLGLRSQHSEVALVGTPTLAAKCMPAWKGNEVDYYGIDAHILFELGLFARLRSIYTVDLLRALDVRQRYSVVVADPPWYEEHVRRFLYFSAKALQTGGHLLLAMPALGTRPGIENENRRVVAWAEDLGLSLLNIHFGALPYETPPFERNALRAAGITNVGAQWRRGDLWILRKEVSRFPVWPGNIDRTPWKEFRFGAVRVRVDVEAESVGSDTSLRSIVAGDVLATVSRRDVRRKAARVWTTGNRVFGCDAPARFASILAAWHELSCPRDWSDDVEQNARNHLFPLIERERIELGWPCGSTPSRQPCFDVTT